MSRERELAYTNWIRENEDKKDTPEYARAVQAYKILRIRSLGQEKPDDPTLKWSAFKPSGEGGGDEVASFGATEIFQGHPLTRYAVGGMRPVLAAGQAAGLPIGGQDLQTRLDRAAKTQEPGVSATADVVGQVMSPINVGLAKATGPLAAAKHGGRLVQGATLGGFGGFLTEVKDPEEAEFWNTKLGQTTGGMTIGAALNALMPLGQGAVMHAYSNWLEPVLANFSPAVRERVKGRIYAAAAGDQSQFVLPGLRNPQQLVQGSMPDAGQASVRAGAPGMAALGESAKRARPDLHLQRADEQSQAVLDNMKRIGDDPANIPTMDKARERVVGPLYNKARTDTSQPIFRPGVTATLEGQDLRRTTGPVVEYIDGLMARNPGNAPLIAEFTRIRKGLMDPVTNEVRTDPGQLVSTLDGIKAAMAHKDNAFILKELDLVKRRLAARLPRWREAEAAFSRESQPISRARIRGELEEAAQPAGGWRPGSGQPLMEENVLKKIDTGFGLASRDLTPAGKQAIEQVKEEFIRNGELQRLAKAGTPVVPDIGGQGTSLPNVLMREAMVMNAILRRLEGKVSQKIASEIATEWLHPPVVGESLQRALRRQQMNKARSEALQEMWRAAIPSGMQQGFGTVESAR